MESIILTEREWVHMSESQKIWALYRTVEVLNINLNNRMDNLHPWSKTCSLIGGIFGGALGVLSFKCIGC